MIQDGQLVKFVNGGDAARIQKVQIAVGRDATRAPRVQHSDRGMPVQVVTGEDPTRAPFIHPFEGLAPAAWFRQGVGITVTGSGVSQWDDQSGNGRHLLQGTDAARPIDLPFSGTRYLYLPGVSGNYASTPDSSANSITGDIDIRVRVALDDWSPSADQPLVNKYTSNTGYELLVMSGANAGKLRLIYGNGASLVLCASTAAAAISDGDIAWVRATRSAVSGDVIFYTSVDGATWTKLGNTVSSSVEAIADGASLVYVGRGSSGVYLAGKLYRAIIKNGIDGTTVVDFNPADASDGASSFASSATGETWTVNTSGALPAQIVGRASALFNGTSHYLKTAAFTLNQPTCVLMVVKQVSWTNGDTIFDGDAANSGRLRQLGTTGQHAIYASGTPSPTNVAGPTVGAIAVLSIGFNGASSFIKVNAGAATTGNPGANNMGGFTLGANGDVVGTHSNIQAYETAIFPIAPSTAQLDRLIAGLMARHGVA